MSMSSTEIPPPSDPGEMGVPEALFDDGEGDVLGLFRAEKRRDSFPLPLLAALLKLSTCMSADLPE